MLAKAAAQLFEIYASDDGFTTDTQKANCDLCLFRDPPLAAGYGNIKRAAGIPVPVQHLAAQY